jgi:hypothetical protein
MKKLSVYEWHKQFKEGREDMKDNPRSRQQETQRADANVDRVWMNLGALRSKIRCETNSRTEYE